MDSSSFRTDKPSFTGKVASFVLAACASLAVAILVGIIAMFALNSVSYVRLTTNILTANDFFRDRFSIPTLVGNTLLVALVALAIAAPIGIFGALYLSEFASVRARSVLHPLVRTLAAIPPVVYAFFAVTTFVPTFRGQTSTVVLAGVSLGLMMLPLVLTHAHAAFSSVPQHLRDAAYALGAGKFATVALVIFPVGKARCFAAVLLAASRAVGETMVVLAINLHPFLPGQTESGHTLSTFMATLRPASTELREAAFGTLGIVGLLLILFAFSIEFFRSSLGKPSPGDATR